MKRKTRHSVLLLMLVLAFGTFTGCTTTDSTSLDSSDSQSAISDPAAEITPIAATYKAEDLDDGWDASGATSINLAGNSVSIIGTGASYADNTISIQQSGTYVLSGELNDGQVVVDAGEDDTVRLVLNNVQISSSNSAPLYSKQAKKTILTLAESTKNTIQDGTGDANTSEEDEPAAAIFSKGDLTINGSGSLTVKGNANNAIVTKDDLVITGGLLTIDAVNHGIRGRDSIAIKDGTFVINAGGDGLQANNDESTDKGWIVLDGGDLTISAGNDGIQAESIVQVADVKLTITSGGGSSNTATITGGNEDALSAKGIKSGTGTFILGGTLSIDASDDSIHSNGQVLIQSGDMKLASADDGIHADTALTINGGDITITKSYEGIESAAITVTNGTVHVTARDDGFNAAGGNDGSSQGGRPGENTFSANSTYYIRITGGDIIIDAGGDGIDANGSLYFNGGTVLVNGPTNNGNGSIDYNSTCEVTGGILVFAGSSGMVQTPGDASSQNSIAVYYSAAQKAGTFVTITDDNGKQILSFAPSKNYQSIIFSSPELEQGKTYTLFSGDAVSGGTKLTDIQISGVVTSIADDGSPVSSGMGGGPGGNRGGKGFPGGTRGPV